MANDVVFHSRVALVEQKFIKRWLRGMGDRAEFAHEPKGWFVCLEGSYEALYVGTDEPNIKAGDNATVRITFHGR